MPDLVATLMDQLAGEGLQSDQRFTEVYLHSRIQKGYGPLRLEQELKARGIDEQLLQSCLAGLDVNWREIVTTVRQKKFRQALPEGFAEQAKESRFLQHRGFTTEQIRQLFKNNNDY